MSPRSAPANTASKSAVLRKIPSSAGRACTSAAFPTKAYLHYADLYDNFKHSQDFGISHGNLSIDMAKMRDEKQKIVDKHAGGVGMLFKKNKVDSIQGYGRLLGGGKIEVDGPKGKKTFSAKKIILATGSRASMLPGLEPNEKILSNIEILDLTKIPKSLAVIGAGAVGMEFASVFHSFGSKVTVFEMLPRVLPVEDEDVSKEIKKIFERKGVEIHIDTKVGAIKKTAKGVSLEYKNSDGKAQKLNVEKLLVAVGRAPVTEDIGLDKTKIVADRGFYQGRRVHAHCRARRLRHRRHRGRRAPTRPHRLDGRSGGGRPHRRQARRADRLQSQPQRHLLRAAGRQRRPDRKASQGPRATK